MSEKAKNPFWEDEDEEGEGGFGSAEGYGTRYGDGGGSWSNNTQAQIQASKERQMASSKNVLRSMYESERIGVSTAEELVDQGERLHRTEKKLDDIGEMQNTAQKNINHLKFGIFSGIRTWWNKGKDKNPEANTTDQYQGSDRLQTAMAHSSVAQSKVDASGFYEPDVNPSDYGGQQQPYRNADTAYERQFQENVSEMSDGMSRLKQLAMGLGDEIDRSNAQVERVADKTDSVNTRMDSQNKQMRGILYGGKK